MHSYKVLPGESLGSISEKFNVSSESLLRINQMSHHQMLSEGQSLSIPVVVLHRRLLRHENTDTIAKSYQIPQDHIISSRRDSKFSFPQILIF